MERKTTNVFEKVPNTETTCDFTKYVFKLLN